ncbi:MAG TPA: sulfite exporter TauE/SafE family protein [Acetobacteraceae bacterium]|nr:sulfite exporter TauE/SafE family protein [Acetobacteraceae bacterium]
MSHSLLWPALHALSWRGLLFLLAVLLLGGLVKGVVSIGVPLVAMPLLAGTLSIRQAVLLLSLPIILGNIPQALEGGHTLPTIRRVAAPMIGMVAGIMLGVSILLRLSPRMEAGGAGLILVIASALLLASPRLHLPRHLAAPFGLALGFVSGLMEGMAAIPGPLLAMYLLAIGATGRQFTKQIALILIVSVIALILTFRQNHHADGFDLAISALAAVPVIGGIIIARPLRDMLSPRLFRVVVLIFVLLAGLNMIRKSGLI